MRRSVIVLVSTLLLWQPSAAQIRIADLGTCSLELGGEIEDCRLAYRTIGTLAEDRRNAVLIPTWFASGSDAWLSLLGPEGIVDTTGVFIVIVESLGAGSSSSPSTSSRHPGVEFPEITVGDMVEVSYRLAYDNLSLPGLKAVVGISLGALQAFEWAVRYPDYVAAIVPIAGSPQQALYQRSAWEVLARTADEAARGKLPPEDAAETLARMGILILSSPARVNRTERSKYDEYLAREVRGALSADLFEWAWQGRAIARHDVAREYGGDLARAAAVWKGRTLIVISSLDHSISPEPAEEFAALTGAELIRLNDPTGHIAIFGDKEAQRGSGNSCGSEPCTLTSLHLTTRFARRSLTPVR